MTHSESWWNVSRDRHPRDKAIQPQQIKTGWKIKLEILSWERNKIEGYKLPLDKEEMKKICKNIIKYNDLLIKEKQFIEEYEPTEDDFVEK